MKSKWIVEKKGYKFDRRIFITIVWVLVAYVGVAILLENGTSGATLTCPETAFAGVCENPMIQWCFDREKVALKICGEYCQSTKPICTQEYIQVGETLGEPPSFLYQGAIPFLVVLLGSGFALNHILYNRKVVL